MENLSNLLSFSFWFDLKPPALIPFFNKAFVGLLFILLFFSLLFLFLKKVKKRKSKKIFEHFYYFFTTNLFIGVIFYFFNYELVPFLSSRFWFIAWSVEMLIWVYVIYSLAKSVPLKKEKTEAEKEYNKYIP